MPDGLPTISIVTPSFNQGYFIAQTVRSVLLQRYPNLEYVLMDGGSTDSTLEVLEPYRDRFAHFQSERDEGQSAAIRDGFRKTSGEIMGWLNSDDVLAPDALNFVGAFFRDHPDVDMIYSNRVIINEEDTVIGFWILPNHSDYLMTHWDLIPQETCFWRRSLYERAGEVDASFKFAVDYDLFTRLMMHGRAQRVKRFLGAFRMHSWSKTHRELESIGMGEIRRVHAQYDLKFGPLAVVRGPLFSRSTQLRAAWHVRKKRVMPGALPMRGWKYDTLWGGLLKGEGLPPGPEALIEAKPTGPKKKVDADADLGSKLDADMVAEEA